MVSAIHQCKSDIGIHMSSPPDLPFTSLCLGCHRTLGLHSLIIQQIPPGYSFYPWYVHVSMLFSQFVLPSPSPILSASLLSISVSPRLPCKRFISTIFLDYIYMHLYMIFVFLLLSYFTL